MLSAAVLYRAFGTLTKSLKRLWYGKRDTILRMWSVLIPESLCMTNMLNVFFNISHSSASFSKPLLLLLTITGPL